MSSRGEILTLDENSLSSKKLASTIFSPIFTWRVELNLASVLLKLLADLLDEGLAWKLHSEDREVALKPDCLTYLRWACSCRQ